MVKFRKHSIKALKDSFAKQLVHLNSHPFGYVPIKLLFLKQGCRNLKGNYRPVQNM